MDFTITSFGSAGPVKGEEFKRMHLQGFRADEMTRPGTVDVKPQAVLCGLADLREVLEEISAKDPADGVAVVAGDSENFAGPRCAPG
jgi:hypothetical protein